MAADCSGSHYVLPHNSTLITHCHRDGDTFVPTTVVCVACGRTLKATSFGYHLNGYRIPRHKRPKKEVSR